jgi:hypothetical protein
VAYVRADASPNEMLQPQCTPSRQTCQADTRNPHVIWRLCTKSRSGPNEFCLRLTSLPPGGNHVLPSVCFLSAPTHRVSGCPAGSGGPNGRRG